MRDFVSAQIVFFEVRDDLISKLLGGCLSRKEHVVDIKRKTEVIASCEVSYP